MGGEESRHAEESARSYPSKPNQYQRGCVFVCVCMCSGRKNVLRKLLRIPYRRLKAGFSVC